MPKEPLPARTAAEIRHDLRIRARTARLKEIGFEGDALTEAEEALNNTVDGSFSQLPDTNDEHLQFLVGIVIAAHQCRTGKAKLINTDGMNFEDFKARLGIESDNRDE